VRAKRSIAVVNLKGGSGKTTTALCLAVGFARRKRRVLLIDGDPQANATLTMLDGQAADGPTLGQVLLDQAAAVEAIRPARLPRIDILPADGALADSALLLTEQLGRERRLRSALRPVEDDYDLIVIDAPPQLNLVTINILNFVNDLLVPVDAGLYSLMGLNRLQDTVEQVRHYLDNRRLRIAGLVLTRAHHNKATRDIEAQLREAFGSLVHQTVIPHSVRVEEAHARHQTVLEFAPRSAPALAYDRLLMEVLSHGQPERDAERPDSSDAA
jgi:chromosome partitioning protein